jgi:hypothetical protein
VTLDVEDFFMAPEHGVLLETVSQISSIARLHDAVGFLLANQYVRCPVSGSVMRVVKGSGMGCQISSDLSDLAFNQRVERFVLPTMGSHGIRSYCRYRDDIMFVCESSVRAFRFLESMKQRAHGIWKLKVEGASCSSLPFLDVLVKLEAGTMAWEPWSKPSKLFLPLHEESSHHPKCHSWPLAECRRLAVNSSSENIYIDALSVFIRQCILARLNGSVIARLCMEMNSWSLFHSPTQYKRVAPGIMVPLILDYHPLLPKFGLLECIEHICSQYSLELFHCVGQIQIVVAYRSTAMRLSSKLRSI